MTTTKTVLMFLLVLLITFPSSHGWGGLVSQTIVAAVVSSLSLLDGDADRRQLMESLRPPTLDMPQIVLPRKQDNNNNYNSKSNENNENDELVQPLVQGLVYLSNPQQSRSLLGTTDVLVLEIRNVMNDVAVVAGAKIPISRIRFPMQFAMSQKNVLAGQKLGEKDLFVQAKICPSVTATTTSCSDEDATLKATGIAKMISNLPGSDGRSMRAGASLGLK